MSSRTSRLASAMRSWIQTHAFEIKARPEPTDLGLGVRLLSGAPRMAVISPRVSGQLRDGPRPRVAADGRAVRRGADDRHARGS